MAAPVTTAPRERTDTTWLFGLLSALFAVSLVLHQLWWDGFEVRTPHAAVVLAATLALLRPTSVPRFAVMVGAEVVAVALDLPFVGSHTLLVLVVGACVLAELVRLTVRERRVPSAATVFEAVGPFLRLALIGVYAAAALAKVNSGFLDPAVSCAASMSRQVAWFDPTLLDVGWRVRPAIAGTVLVEAALPVLLAVRRTRVVGLVLGGGFHVVLALAGNVPFSALAFALYVVFLPLDTPQWVRALLARRGTVRGARVVALVLMVGAWLAGAAAEAADPAGVAVAVGDGTRGAVVVLALVAGGVLVATRIGAGEPPRYPPRSLRVRSPVLVVGLVVLVVSAASPYLGLKTDSSFEMFSNLRTEPGAWNHLLIPEAVRVFHEQDGAVRVLDSTDPALLARGRGADIVPFELDRYLRMHPGTVVTYLAPGGTSPRTAGPLPPGPTPAERIAVFRDLPPPGVPRC